LVSGRHPLLLHGQHWLAWAYFHARRFAECEAVVDEMTPNVAAVYGDRSWQYADHLGAKATLHLATGRADAGLSLARQALEVADATERPPGDVNDVQRARGWLLLGHSLLDAGEPTLARRSMAEGVAALPPGVAGKQLREKFKALETRLGEHQGDSAPAMVERAR
jgi:hypothetical protein